MIRANRGIRKEHEAHFQTCLSGRRKRHPRTDGTEGVELELTEDAIDAIADVAVEVNSAVENIGARRLSTVMERVLDEISFDAADRAKSKFTIDAPYVQKHVGDLAKNADLSKFIL